RLLALAPPFPGRPAALPAPRRIDDETKDIVEAHAARGGPGLMPTPQLRPVTLRELHHHHLVQQSARHGADPEMPAHHDVAGGIPRDPLRPGTPPRPRAPADQWP